MKATRQVPAELFDNETEFNSSFFKQFDLIKRQPALDLGEGIVKDYKFPTFYGDTECVQVGFLCDYDAAQKLMPSPELKPLNMLNGRSLVIIAAYRYNKVLNVVPYNEIAVTIPVLKQPALNLPILPLLKPNYKNFGFYVLDMPVTSLENQIRGTEIWGLPKTVNDIEINSSDKNISVNANNSQGEDYLQLTLPIPDKTEDLKLQNQLFSFLNNQMLQSENKAEALFKSKKNLAQLLSSNNKTSLDDSPYISLGNCAEANRLRQLKLYGEPLMIRYTDKMEASFSLPTPIK